MKNKLQIFSYSWHIDEEQTETTIIRVYGLDKKNRNVCLKIPFTPYVYIELPTYIKWDESKASLVLSKIDYILGTKRPIRKAFLPRKKLYYANLNTKKQAKKFPYLFCSFSTASDIKQLSYKIRKPILINGIGNVQLKLHEHNASPIIQLVSQRKLPTAGWIEYKGTKVEENDKETICDYEYNVNWHNTKPLECNSVAKPLIMGFDIEVNSSNPAKMPNANKPGDKVFQISCILSRYGDTPDKYDKYLLSLGKPDSKIVGEDVTLLLYDTEAELLIGFTQFITKHNPNILVGYNIMGFDLPYMIARAKRDFGCTLQEFDKMSFLKNVHCKEKTISWSSSAYKNQTFQFLDAEGRLFVDLLPLIRRDYKFNNYKLKTVASFFLKGFTKDDLDAQGIFKCYRIGMEGGKKGAEAMGKVGKYCVKDSVLMNMLFENLQTWIGLCEMATVTNVPMFYLYTQGQQIKVFSQLYKKCTHLGITVEKDGYIPKDDEHYSGAMVFPPKPGIYDKVIPFDFSSLYPSTIIAYNLDYSTLVQDESVPDSDCHVIEWEDHAGCEHDPKVKRKMELTKHIKEVELKLKQMREDKRGKRGYELMELKLAIEEEVEKLKPYRQERSELNKSKLKHKMCAKRKFRWLKKPLGILPSLLKNLLEARAQTKKEIKKIKKDLKENNYSKEKRLQLETLLVVLDKRQLAYKVSANSAYGATGVQRGYLPMMPIAMCTAAMGRKNITVVANVIPKKFKGELIYGDTDSNYISFPHLKDATAAEIWEYSEYVADEVSKLFPAPNRLAFEEIIYWRFLILTKKRYMSLGCGKDGIIDRKIKKKGVLLTRRDNCEFVRNIYSQVILKLFDNKSRDEILYFILQEINKLCSGVFSSDKFIITQAIGDTCNMALQPYYDEKGKEKGMIGDYKVDILPPPDTEDYKKKLKLKNASSEEEYYLRCLPAQVQLAEKMGARGRPVEPGTRLEYVVIEGAGHTAKKYEKIESIEYYNDHSNVLTIDYLWYLKQLCNPLDQVLNVMYLNKKSKYEFKKDFMLTQYNYRVKIRQKMLQELKDIFHPKIIFTK